MTTLNCPEEVYLAEKLIKLHPWAGMVRFSRSGGEANLILLLGLLDHLRENLKLRFAVIMDWHDKVLQENTMKQFR